MNLNNYIYHLLRKALYWKKYRINEFITHNWKSRSAYISILFVSEFTIDYNGIYSTPTQSAREDFEGYLFINKEQVKEYTK